MTRWLTDDQQQDWRAYIVGTTLLMDTLDRELRQAHGIALAEYEILVRLSEFPDRTLRMAQIASSVRHSRSRVTHTVARMEKAGWLERREATGDGRGVSAFSLHEAHLAAAAGTRGSDAFRCGRGAARQRDA